MTRLEEFKDMIQAIENADMWDAHPEYFEKLCYWYDINMSDYDDPDVLFAAIVEAYKSDLKENGEKKNYTVFWIGGERDGEILGYFENENDAINYADAFWKEHESEFDPLCGGVGIEDMKTGNAVEW